MKLESTKSWFEKFYQTISRLSVVIYNVAVKQFLAFRYRFSKIKGLSGDDNIINSSLQSERLSDANGLFRKHSKQHHEGGAIYNGAGAALGYKEFQTPTAVSGESKRGRKSTLHHPMSSTSSPSDMNSNLGISNKNEDDGGASNQNRARLSIKKLQKHVLSGEGRLSKVSINSIEGLPLNRTALRHQSRQASLGGDSVLYDETSQMRVGQANVPSPIPERPSKAD